MNSRAQAWPYPRWIAHRGAGKLAPENTLAAFRVGAQHGFRMFECDAKLSADGVPFLLHDASLGRTSNAAALWAKASGSDVSAVAGEHAWSRLAQLDAGSWHSPGFAGEPLPTLANIARYCLLNGYALNIEIKPTPGTERLTGAVVAQHAARLWQGAEVPPLLSSFAPEALAAAQAAAPHLPRALLLDHLPPDWLDIALQLACVAIVCKHSLWNARTVQQARGAGFKSLSYTVNDTVEAQRLEALGTDGIITDRVDVFSSQL